MAESAKFNIAKLGNGNYPSWKFRMEMLLVREELFYVICDPRTDPVTEAWTKDDRKARATLGLCVEESQFGLIKGKASAKEMWESLQEYHEKHSVSSRVSLLKKLCSKNLQENGDMEAHLQEIEVMFDRLQGADLKLDKELKVALLLRTLPESYNGLVVALESRPDADLTLDFVKSRLLDEHQKRLERGHIAGGSKLLKTVASKPGEKTCFFCKKPGHFRKNCRKYQASLKVDSGENRSQNIPRAKKAAEASPLLFWTKVETASAKMVDAEQAVRCSVSGASSLWYVDSGASQHMTCNKNFFTELMEDVQIGITLANGNTTHSQGVGHGLLRCVDDEGQEREIQVQNVLYVPELEGSLLSVSTIVNNQFVVSFNARGCKVLDKDGAVAAVADLIGGMYVLKTNEKSMVSATARHTEYCPHTWHRRFGHRDIDVIDQIKKNDLATHMKVIDCGVKSVCECCLECKMSRKPFPKVAENRAKSVLDLVHTDVCGPFQNVTPGANKSEVSNKIIEFVRLAENQMGKKPRVIRSDNGGEYVTKALEDFYAAEGIRAEYTSPYSPQQNGVAERKNRYLQEMALCMLLDAGLPKLYWSEAVMTATFLQNRLPSRSIGCSPYEKLFNKKPVMQNLKVFGSEAFVYIPAERRRKFENRARKLIFIGYCTQNKAYRFLDRKTGRIVVSRDAQFLELGAEIGEESESDKTSTNDVEIVIGEKSEKVREELRAPEESDDDSDESFYDPEAGSSGETAEESAASGGSEEPAGPSADGDPAALAQGDDGNRRSRRSNLGVLPQHLNDFVVGLTAQCSGEPGTYREAMAGPEKKQWLAAMKEELRSLEENDTWSLVTPPAGCEPIGSRWVFKKKEDAQGKVVRFKARLVAQGYSQKFGRDFDQVFAPVAMQSTFRVLLSIASQKKMDVYHVDVKTAYLYGTLEEEIFMRQPPGFVVLGKEACVCKLNRSIYGLKQAARVWNSTIKDFLIAIDFVQSSSDACLYMKKLSDREWMYLLIYVDDILIVCREKNQVQRVEEELKKRFRITSLGPVRLFLGIAVNCDSDGVYSIDQSSFIRKIAKTYGLDESKKSKIPMDTGYYKYAEKSEVLPNNTEYHSLVGSLLYVSTNTRPDIAASVSILSRKIQSPSLADWTELKRVVRYLVGTADHRLQLGTTQADRMSALEGFCDADWASDTSDRKSNSGFVFRFGEATISWASRKQNCVSTSTMEAEYVALAEAVQEVVWLRRLLAELGEKQPTPTIIFEDNKSCLDFVALERQNRRSKHIDTKFHYVKDAATSGQVVLRYCATTDMLADIMTKPLGPVQVAKFVEMLGLKAGGSGNR